MCLSSDFSIMGVSLSVPDNTIAIHLMSALPYLSDPPDEYAVRYGMQIFFTRSGLGVWIACQAVPLLPYQLSGSCNGPTCTETMQQKYISCRSLLVVTILITDYCSIWVWWSIIIFLILMCNIYIYFVVLPQILNHLSSLGTLVCWKIWATMLKAAKRNLSQWQVATKLSSEVGHQVYQYRTRKLIIEEVEV